MLPISHQPGRLFVTAKTHKFDCIYDITLDQLKLRPIIDQTGTYLQRIKILWKTPKITIQEQMF